MNRMKSAIPLTIVRTGDNEVAFVGDSSDPSWSEPVAVLEGMKPGVYRSNGKRLVDPSYNIGLN